jgi:hypothetical protein
VRVEYLDFAKDRVLDDDEGSSLADEPITCGDINW